MQYFKKSFMIVLSALMFFTLFACTKNLTDHKPGITEKQVKYYPTAEDIKEIVENKSMEADEILKSLDTKNEYVIDLENDLKAYGDTEYSFSNGAISLTSDENYHMMETKKEYTFPLKIDIRAKTNSSNLRLYFNRGMIVFNWEEDYNELRVYDIYTNWMYGFKHEGYIGRDFVDITWIIEKDFMALIVDGEVRHYGTEYPYMNENITINPGQVKFGPAWGSEVTVSDLKITELN